MKIGDQVLYFTDNGADMFLGMIIARPTPAGAIIMTFPKDAYSGYTFRDANSGGIVPNASSLQECFTPGDRFITMTQATTWGINLGDGTQDIEDLLEE
jgi:hypothetical protein